MPPLPPTNGNGGGGSGGSMPPPPAPPTNGNQYQPQQAPSNVAVLERKELRRAYFNDMNHLEKIAFATYQMLVESKYNDLEYYDAIELINPMVVFWSDGKYCYDDMNDCMIVMRLAESFAEKRLSPTPSVLGLEVTLETVITAIEGESSSEFHYGDRLLKELKRAANVEVKNWENMNGTPRSIRERCIAKSSELDEAVRKVRASSEVRQTVCNYFADNISPIIRSKVEEWNKEGKKS
jgi:hypothetical protein